MKNVLIHLNPTKEFDMERSKLVKIQIDNSYDLGWKKEDILLITNFPYEYNRVKSLVIDDKNYCPFRPKSTNTVTVPYLFELGLIEKDKVYWVHDFDAYQMNPFDGFALNADIGLTTYGWSPKWCLGSFFFKYEAKDVFDLIKEAVYSLQVEDERALRALTGSNYTGIGKRYEILNITYNFGMRNVDQNFPIATKPLRVLHFHPYYKETGLIPLKVFMYGENELGFPLMDKRLIGIFKQHGI
jgi:hypothetical protein